MKNLLHEMKKPKWRHGNLNALMLIALLVTLTLLVVAVDSLEHRYGLARDLSFNNYATLSDESKAVLSSVDTNVNIYLLFVSGQIDVQLQNILQRYEVENPMISLIKTDIAKNPAILDRFSGSSTIALEPDTVIVHNTSTDRYRIINYQDFLAQGYSMELEDFVVEGLAYERSITEAISYVSEKVVPTIGLLSGHGEMDMESMARFVSFLHDNNYESTPINILSGDTLDNVDLLLISSLQNDMTDDEITILDNFARNGGNFIFLRDYTDPIDGLTNYHSLLRSYGIIPMDGIVVASDKDKGSYFSELVYLLPYMLPLDFTTPLISAGADVLMLPGASAFEPPPEPTKTLSVGSVLQSGPNAYLSHLNNDTIDIIQNDTDPVGTFDLALYSHKMFANGNVSRSFALGNSALFMDDYIYQRTYAEPFMLSLLSELLPHRNFTLDIENTSAFRPSLLPESSTIGLYVVVALPLSITLIAFFVLLRRRNK